MNSPICDWHRYSDIIDLPHPVLPSHPQMPLENRAAQFAPFAALVGFDADIMETARLTDRRMELDEEEKLLISDKLQLLQSRIGAQPTVAVTFFQSDGRKEGGAYISIVGAVKKVDIHERMLVMLNKKRIPIDDLISLEGELFEGMDGYEPIEVFDFATDSAAV